MAAYTRQPFVYTLANKMEGDQPSGNTTISNTGITKVTSATTYTLQAPVRGALKTIYRSASVSTAGTSIAAGSGISFDSNGGTQVLVLRPSTAAGPDISVTLIGEDTTQWRIISAYPSLTASSTIAGVVVTT